MFFWLSKTLGQLILPPNCSLVLLVIALICRLLRRWAWLRRWSLRLGVATLVLFSMPLVSNGLLYPLESAHPRPTAAPRESPVIVLFAGITRSTEHDYELNGAADRLIETVRMARRYPQAKVVISGGTNALFKGGFREAPLLGKLSEQLGVDKARLIIEDQARNTRENAVYVAKLLGPLPQGPALLITSAAHMPRAIGCLSKALEGKRPIIAWPVDYLRDPWMPYAIIPGASHLLHSRAALNEYIGLLAYQVAGYL